MEEPQPQSLFWSIPSEIIISIFSLLPVRSIINFETASKTQSNQFNERELYKRLSCDLFRGPNGREQVWRSSVTNWKAEFIIASIHHQNIIRNRLGIWESDKTEIKKQAPNHFSAEQDADPTITAAFQSKIALHPHPIGDFTVAYYEVRLISRQYSDKDLLFSLGAALDGYDGLAGTGRNSFAYTNKGQVLLEFAIAPAEFPVYDAADMIGFGIDFKTRAVFWTLNGQLVCTKTDNYWHEPLLNLDTLHAVVSCHQGFEFSVNFGASPFMFDILKYQRQRVDMNPTRELDSDNNYYNDAILSYNLTMLNHVTKYVEEDTLKAIDSGSIRHWAIVDFNRPTPLPDLHPFLMHLLYSGDKDPFVFYELIMANSKLFKSWKDDKLVQNYLINMAQLAGVLFDEEIDSFDELIDSMQTEADLSFTIEFYDLLQQYKGAFHTDFAEEDNVAPEWINIAIAYIYLVKARYNHPAEHYSCQALARYLNSAVLKQRYLSPILEGQIDEVLRVTLIHLVQLRLKVLKYIILEKNSKRKQEFEKRNAWIKDLYSHILPMEVLNSRMATKSSLTLPPKKTSHPVRYLITNLIALHNYSELDVMTKSETIVEILTLLGTYISVQQITTEKAFVAEAKKRIDELLTPQKQVIELENMKENVMNGDQTSLVKFAKLFGVDPDTDFSELCEEIDKKFDELIVGIKKANKTVQVTWRL